MRHFVRLSQWNFCIDSQLYPLGSCTMKYNPKINEWAARMPDFLRLHPMTPDALAQGSLEVMWHLERYLCEVSGMDACSLQPAAGAQGELTGLMMMRAYHASQGRSPKKVLIPESAHGTNPASCTLNGLVAVKIDKNDDGITHPEEVLRAIEREGGDVCGLMMTNPNTLGVYEKFLPDIVKLVHDKGGLVYGDGANTNAIMGAARPGDLGVDVIHINLHKTFTTPHGGGGPGSGPVCFKQHLEPFAPSPVVVKRGDAFALDYDRPHTVGRLRAFQGNFGMFIRAYTYIREMGGTGLTRASSLAVHSTARATFWAKRRRPLRGAREAALHARGRPQRLAARARDGREDARRREAPARLRLPRADRVFPARRPRRAHDRAHRDRDEGDARRVRRRDDRDRRGGARQSGHRQGSAAQHGGWPSRRGPSGPSAAPPLVGWLTLVPG